MNQKTPHKRVLFGRILLGVVTGLVAIAWLLFGSGSVTDKNVYAAANSTVNFQARLLNAAGAIVPDGNYNVDFRLYDDSSLGGGSVGTCTSHCLWEETYTTSTSTVRVSDGYLTVSLGTYSAFPSTINWSKQLWIGMNIGGTNVSPTWDGEMTPRLQLTAVPYALQAQALQKTDASNGDTSTLSFASGTATGNYTVSLRLPTANSTVCYENASTCGFLQGSGTAFIEGGQNFGTNQTLGSIDNTGLNIETNSFTVESLSNTGAALFQNSSNSATAFQIQDSAGTGNLFVVSSSGQAIGVNKTPGSSTSIWSSHTSLDVHGEIATDTDLKIGGVSVCTVSGCSPSTGSGSYIQNSTALQTNASFNIRGASGAVTATLAASNTSPVGADILDLEALGTQVLDRFDNNGSLSIGGSNASASTTALQVQQAGFSGIVFGVDTANNRVRIGQSGSTSLINGTLFVGTPFTLSNVSQTIIGGSNESWLAVQGKYAYTIDTTDNNLRIFDVSNPAGTVYISTYLPPACTNPTDIIVQGNYAYETYSSGICIIDITSPYNPQLVKRFSLSAVPMQIAIEGKYLYAPLNTANSLKIVDISNPFSPTVLSTLTLQGTAPEGVAVQGNYVYIADDNGCSYPYLEVVDVTNSQSPVSIGYTVMDNAYTCVTGSRVAVQGRYAYTIDGPTGGETHFDISNPRNPTNLTNGSIASPYSELVQGRYEIIGSSAGSGVIRIYDVTGGSYNSVVTTNGIGIPKATVLSGHYLYDVDGTNLNIVDLGGAFVSNLETNNISAGSIQVSNSLSVGGNISLQGGLTASNIQASGSATLGGLTIYGVAAPSASIATTGSTGTAYSYTVAAVDNGGSTISPSVAASSAATLNTSNYNTISWSPTTPGYNYVVYRYTSSGTPSSTGQISPLIYYSTLTALTPNAFSMSGTTATITFYSGNTAPYVVNQTITLAGFTPSSINGTYIIKTATQNGGGINLTVTIPGGPYSASVIGTATGNAAFVDNGVAAYGNNPAPTTSTAGALTANGSALFTNLTNSTTAFQIQNSSGTNLFQVDTTGGAVTIGASNQSGTITLGQSTSTNFVQIGNNIGAAATQTVSIATSTSGSNNVTIGAVSGSGTISINAGSGGITLNTGANSTVSIGNNLVTGVTFNIGQTGTSSNTSTVNIATASNNQQLVSIGSTYSTSTTTISAASTSVIENSVGLNVQTTSNSSGLFNVQNAASQSVFGIDSSVGQDYAKAFGKFSATNYTASSNNTWTGTTALPQTLKYINNSAVAYNGYLYVIGGSNTSGDTPVSNVYYAQINANGTLGSWFTGTAYSSNIELSNIVFYNGFIYGLGGFNGSSTSAVYYAPVNADGSLGSWTSTTNLPSAGWRGEAVAYKGYIYYLGNTGMFVSYYAPIKSNGSVGSWTITNNPTGIMGGTALAFNGYIYSIQGASSQCSATSATYYSQIQSNGSLAAWSPTTVVPYSATNGSATVVGSSIYVVGGDTSNCVTGDATTNVYSANINTSNGSIGTWTAGTSLGTARAGAGLATWNGNLYSLGGSTGQPDSPVTNVNYSTVTVAATSSSSLNSLESLTLGGQGAILSNTAGNSTSAFQVQNNIGTSVFNVDTTNNSVKVTTAVNSMSAFQVQNTANITTLNVDNLSNRVSINSTFAQVSTPAMPTLSIVTQSGLFQGTSPLYYKITAVDTAGGETNASPEASTAITNNHYVNVSWSAVTGAAYYNVYKGYTTGNEHLLATTSSLSYADNTGQGTNGAPSPPTTNSAYYSSNVTNTKSLALNVGGQGSPTGQLYVSGFVPTGTVPTFGPPSTNFLFSSTGMCTKPFIQGHYVYGLNCNGYVVIYDITNPLLPTQIATNSSANVNLTSADISDSVGDTVYVSGHYMFASNQGGNGSGGIYMFDVSNPVSPQLVWGNYPVDPINLTGQGKYLYSYNGNGTFYIIDISNPLSPVLLSNVLVPITNSISASAYYMTAQGNYLYGTNTSGTYLWIMDISNPKAPFISASYNTGINVNGGVAVLGRYAYVTGYSGTSVPYSYFLQVYDVSNPKNITSVSSTTIQTNGGTNAINAPVVQDHYAYINDGSHFIYTVDVSNQASPSLLGTGTISGGGSVDPMTVSGRYAYAADGSSADDGLRVIDLGGTYTQALEAGSADLGSLQVQSSANVAGSLSVQAGLNVQSSAMFNNSVGINGSLIIGSVLPAPTISSVIVNGAGGTTSYSYKVTAIDQSGGESTPSAAYTVTNGSSTLTSSNFNAINISGGYTSADCFDVYRTATTSTLSLGLIGNVCGTFSFADKGAIGDTIQPSATGSAANLTANGNIIGNGTALFQDSNGGNLTTAFMVEVGSQPILTADEQNYVLYVGDQTAASPTVLLQVSNYSAYADQRTCNGANLQGAMYYNNTAGSIRACINNGWQDLVSTDGLGIYMFGVVAETGTNADDLAGVTGAANGPCKVSWLSSTSVTVNGCTAYSGGRKVIVTSTTISSLSAASTWYHICLNGTNNQPTSTSNASETGGLPSFSTTAPIVCLADVQTGGGSTITNIYDTRTFLETTKYFATVNTSAPGLGWIVEQTATAGVMQPSTTATDSNLQGVVVASAGNTSTNTINAIIAVNGPAFVKATGTSSVNGLVIPTTTTGYSGTGTNSSTYGTLGIAQRTIDTTCTASTNCQYSQLVRLNIR